MKRPSWSRNSFHFQILIIKPIVNLSTSICLVLCKRFIPSQKRLGKSLDSSNYITRFVVVFISIAMCLSSLPLAPHQMEKLRRFILIDFVVLLRCYNLVKASIVSCIRSTHAFFVWVSWICMHVRIDFLGYKIKLYHEKMIRVAVPPFFRIALDNLYIIKFVQQCLQKYTIRIATVVVYSVTDDAFNVNLHDVDSSYHNHLLDLQEYGSAAKLRA